MTEARPTASATTVAADTQPTAQASAANPLSPSQAGSAATRSSDLVEKAPKAAREVVSASRKRRVGEGRKHPRLQFLDDGSPLLE